MIRNAPLVRGLLSEPLRKQQPTEGPTSSMIELICWKHENPVMGDPHLPVPPAVGTMKPGPISRDNL